jgi:hypothetical protein
VAAQGNSDAIDVADGSDRGNYHSVARGQCAAAQPARQQIDEPSAPPEKNSRIMVYSAAA